MTVVQILKALLPEIESQHERDEHYLAASVDDCDLERRLHEIDDRGRDVSTQAIALGLYER
ncbi:MAG: DUF3563 domain-containing protein [Comamonadaceae bacterium]|nr:DUF3563 domain-containing protein [Comamonadaceae bacterium]